MSIKINSLTDLFSFMATKADDTNTLEAAVQLNGKVDRAEFDKAAQDAETNKVRLAQLTFAIFDTNAPAIIDHVAAQVATKQYRGNLSNLSMKVAKTDSAADPAKAFDALVTTNQIALAARTDETSAKDAKKQITGTLQENVEVVVAWTQENGDKDLSDAMEGFLEGQAAMQAAWNLISAAHSAAQANLNKED